MATLPDVNNFPVNETIDFNGQSIKIQRYLQSGYTSNVFAGMLTSTEFHGERPVAIKVIKQVLGEESVKLFNDECKVLEKLMDFERVEDPFTACALKAAPIYYGSGQYKGNNYIVMELVDAQEINQMITRQGPLPEEQAIKISWQLFQFLEVLHTKVQKTIFDYKDENFWWTEANGGQIRVIDLGGLPDVRKDARFQGNTTLAVLKTAAFLLKVFTGKSLFIPMTQEFEDPRLIIDEAPISWGTKALLKKALHTNPKFRLTDAGELKEAFSELFDYWQPGVDLRSAIEGNLSKFEEFPDHQSNDAKECAARAKTLDGILEVQKKLPANELSSLKERCDKAYEQSEYLMGGKNLFGATDYRSAEAQFKLGLENGENDKLYRDWFLIAEAASQNPEKGLTKENRLEMEKVVDHLQAGKFVEALARLNNLQINEHILGLERIMAEAHIFLALDQAQDLSFHGEYQQAASLIGEAKDKLSLLTDVSPSIIAEVGDLQDRYEEYESLARTRGEAQEKQEEGKSLIERGEMDSAYRAFADAWRKYPETAFHSTAMIQAMDQLVQKQDFSAATRLAVLAQRMPELDQKLFEKVNEIASWYRLYQAAEVEDARGLSAAIYSLSQQISSRPEEKDILAAFVRKTITLWIEKKEDEKLKLIQPAVSQIFQKDDLSKILTEALAEFENHPSSELVDAVDAGISKLKANLCMLNANNLFMEERNLSPFEVGRICANKSEEIRKIQPFLEDVTAIARSIHYRMDEVEAFTQQIAQKSSDVTQVSQRAKQKVDEANQKGIALENQFHQVVESHRHLLENTASASSPQSQEEKTNFENKLVALYAEAYESAQIENDPQGKAAHLLSTISEYFDQAPLDFWKEISEFSHRKLDELNIEKEQLIKQLRQGDFQPLAIWLEQKKAFLSKDPEYQQLVMMVNQTQVFDRWLANNESRIMIEGYQNDIIESIRNAMKFNVPVYYLKKGRVVSSYLDRCQGTLLGAIQSSLKGIAGYDQSDLVNQFVNVRKTFTQFESYSK
jgi:hypothetical protein